MPAPARITNAAAGEGMISPVGQMNTDSIVVVVD